MSGDMPFGTHWQRLTDNERRMEIETRVKTPRGVYGPLIATMASAWSVKAQMLDRDECWTLVPVPGDTPGIEPDRAARALNLAAVVHALSEIDGHGDPMQFALDALTGSALLDEDTLRWSIGNRIATLIDAIEDAR